MSTYNVLPKEALNLLSGDYRQWFNFYPLGEVIYCDDEEPNLPFCLWEGAEYVQPTSGKGPRGKYGVYLFWR